MTSALAIIAMLTSKVALLAFAIVTAKFITKRMKLKKIDRVLMKMHKKAACILTGSVLMHAATSLFAIATTPIAVYIAGFMSLFAIAVATKTFVSRKAIGNKWQHFHRAAAALAVIALILHLILRS